MRRLLSLRHALGLHPPTPARGCCRPLQRRCFCPPAGHAAAAEDSAAGGGSSGLPVLGPASLPSKPSRPSIHDKPKIMRPGDFVDVGTVIRNWWSFPAVGFNSILEIPVEKMEVFPPEEARPIGSVVVPNSIFGLPICKHVIFRAYWYHRRKLAGYQKDMQLYKWEWPGSNKKVRSQRRSGKGRIGRRKAPSFFDGVYAHPLRPRDWGVKQKLNRRVLFLAVKTMLSVKFVQDSIKVVDSFNLQSHKTKYLVQHLRRLLGRKCHSAMLIHEGTVDVNDNFRWASAHIPAVCRQNVEGVSVYNLLKYHQIVMTEAALTKLIREIQGYPRKAGWGQRYATPDAKPAPLPEKVPGWNKAWVEKKERIRNAEFRAKEFYRENKKWKWNHQLKGPLKIPKEDPLYGFRVKDFVSSPERPVWEKLESLYVDDEPLEEEMDDEEFAELEDSFRHNMELEEAIKGALIEDPREIQTQELRHLAGSGGRKHRRPLVAGEEAKQVESGSSGKGEVADS